MNIAILMAMLQYWGNRTPDLTVIELKYIFAYQGCTVKIAVDDKVCLNLSLKIYMYVL